MPHDKIDVADNTDVLVDTVGVALGEDVVDIAAVASCRLLEFVDVAVGIQLPVGYPAWKWKKIGTCLLPNQWILFVSKG